MLGLFFASFVAGYGGVADARAEIASPVRVSTAAATSNAYSSVSERRALASFYRLAVAGRSRCAASAPISGLLLRNLAQYALADRAGVSAQFGLDRGPMVAAVVAGSPAATSGVLPGDVLLAINGEAPPPPSGLSRPFAQQTAQAYSDSLETMLARTDADGRVQLSILRDGRTLALRFTPALGCPSLLHLARSAQRNAFADGRHIFITSKVADLAANDDALAFIIAHEMAHNILHHADRLHAAGIGHGALRALGESGRIVRQTEREADLLGADLMLDAGYDPVRGVAGLNMIDRDPLRIGMFDDHDSNARRIAAIREHVAGRIAAPAAGPARMP